LSLRALETLLERLAETEVAAEVLWPGPPTGFVGARFRRTERSHLRVIAARANCAPSYALKALAGGSLGPAVRAELGAVNAWHSVGPLPVALDVDAAAVASALRCRADLALCDHPVALEVVHEGPRPAWWAIEVSSKAAGGHQVHAHRVAYLLSSMASKAGVGRP
jgi:hypothetical protein